MKFQESADSSEPLFSMYLELAGTGDKKVAEDYQKDAKPIIIFVRISVLFSIPLHISSQYYRRVCSLSPLRYFLP
jgi:hypothetical protein